MAKQRSAAKRQKKKRTEPLPGPESAPPQPVAPKSPALPEAVEALIAALPWRQPHVRNDVNKQVPLRLSEPVQLMLEWLDQLNQIRSKADFMRTTMEEKLQELVASTLVTEGVPEELARNLARIEKVWLRGTRRV